MPRMDGTGPSGTGPIGQGLGPCGQGNPNRFSQGWGRAFRRGGSYRWNTMNPPLPDEEIEFLESHKSWLESRIEYVKDRITRLSQGKASGNEP